MPKFDYDNLGSSIASVTVITHAEVYDGLDQLHQAWRAC